MTAPQDPFDVFNVLESNDIENVKNIKTKFAELFNTVKESWLVYGFIDYYLATGSMRAVDILIKVPAPHDKHVFDKLVEGIRGSSSRCDFLGLLGHIVRLQPLWLYKITNHSLFRELLTLLKKEKEIVPLMSGLLVLITLLPMIPTLISPFFNDIFEVFGRLATWESHASPERAAGCREHLRLGLYGLFHNLYGMYPCNFIDYLKREYGKKENLEIFTHTVKPMLETVKVHPLLITASTIAETDNARWKKKEHHDVVMECRRFSAEGTHKQRPSDADDSHFRSRCGTDVSSLLGSTSAHIQTSKSSNSTPNLTESLTLTKTTITTIPSDAPTGAVISVRYDQLDPGSWVSLLDACSTTSAPSAPQTPLPGPYQDTPVSYTPISQLGQQQDSGSPPEAAIEATPENTPIKDGRPRFSFPNNSSAVRALGSRLVQPHPIQAHVVSLSQPPSPLKKESSPFSRVPSVEPVPPAETQEIRKDVYYSQNKLGRILHERSQTTESFSPTFSSPKPNSSSPQKKISLKDCSNLNFSPSVPNSPVPLGTAAPLSGTTEWPLAKPKPHKDGMPFDIISVKENITNLSLLTNPIENMKDDKEIIELSKRGEVLRSTSIVKDAHLVLAVADQRDGEAWAEEEEPCDGAGVHCSDRAHGLHMPSSASKLNLCPTRLRYYSQCIHEPATDSISKKDRDKNPEFTNGKSFKLRKAMSWPNIKTTSCEKMTKNYDHPKSKYDRNLSEIQAAVAFENGNITSLNRKETIKTQETQTVDVWPMTYEYLYTDIAQNFCEQKAGEETTEEINSREFSPYHQVDKYIEIISQRSNDHNNKRSPKEEVEHLKQQLQLIQLELMYERHRREVHAIRNRSLLGKSRKNRAAEEQNQALKQQIPALQLEIEDLRRQLSEQNQKIQGNELKNIETIKYWESQVRSWEREFRNERQEKEKYCSLLLEQQNISNETSADVQQLRARLFDVTEQLKRATRKSEVCDQLVECIKMLQREITMYGEKEARYSVLSMLPTKTNTLVNRVTQQFKEQLMSAQATLQAQASKMEYCQAREAELESAVQAKDAVVQDLKKQLRLVKEEYSKRLNSVQEKYQSVKQINQRMEAHCLDLLQRIPQSPQTTSREHTSGFSPQSSPLSASLASSESYAPLLACRVDEIRNLQVIANAQEPIEESTSNNSVNNSTLEEDH